MKTFRPSSGAFSALLSALIILSSCTTPDSIPDLKNYDAPVIEGQAFPVLAELGKASWNYADWFGPDFEPDSVSYPPGTNGRISEGRIYMQIGGMEAVAPFVLWKDGNAYHVPIYRSDKQIVELEFKAEKGQYESVSVVGEFNGWTPSRTSMIPGPNGWKTGMPLSPGNWQYLIVADGTWLLDPANSDSVSNGNGGYNSLLRVQTAPNPPFIRTVSHSTRSIKLALEGEPDEVLVLWNYARLDESHLHREGSSLEISIPKEASDKERSFLRVWAWKGDALSNDLLIELQEGKVLSAPSNRMDKRAMSIYFPLVDRFANGNTSNDKPVDDKRILPPANYHGGDLAGITQHLDYIDDLGCNTIWLSPITRNPDGAFQEYPEPRRWFSGYHGYWPIRHGEVDPRFGTDEELQSLVDGAHDRDMNVILDFVANHVHKEHPLYQQHPEWATDLDLPGGRKNIRIWEEERLTTWFDDFLPTIDLTNPDAIEWMTDSAIYWMEKFNMDGFRHDATKHIPEEFWRALTLRLKQNFPDRELYQIGETYGSRDLIASYLSPGMMEAQFDFPLFNAALNAFSNTEANLEDLAAELEASLRTFGQHHTMGNITGNHDKARLISVVGRDFAPGENPSQAGWVREVGTGGEDAYDRATLLHAFNCAIPGIPVIYYGDEIGMPGGGDPDSRRMMRFKGLSEAETSMKTDFRQLLQARERHPALIYGSTEIYEVSRDVLVIRRDYFGQQVYLGVNKGLAETSVELPNGESLQLRPLDFGLHATQQ